MRFTYSRAPAEDPAGFIDIRPALILSTKVLADMLTIDEVSRGCSNPKVERFKTEVYGRSGEWAIDFSSKTQRVSGLAVTLFRGAMMELALLYA